MLVDFGNFLFIDTGLKVEKIVNGPDKDLRYSVLCH